MPALVAAIIGAMMFYGRISDVYLGVMTVELEFYVRVIPTAEGIATAAQALGAKSFTVDGIRNLLEGRFVDAVQAVAARHTMDSLHEGRAEFVSNISDLSRDNLKQNGILLDSVSLTRLDQSAFSSFDENNAFNVCTRSKRSTCAR